MVASPPGPVILPAPVPDVGTGGVGNDGTVFFGKPAIAQPDVQVVLDDVAIDQQQQPFGTLRDAFWPQFTVAWLVVSLVLVLLSVQLVSPTRRWRLRRSRRLSPPAEVTS